MMKSLCPKTIGKRNTMSIALSVNLNKVALIRNSRPGDYPNVLEFGTLCLDCGAQGLTVHPRPDQRHIRPEDVRRLARLVHQRKHVELNIEGNPFAPAEGSYPGMQALAEETQPHQCTLVPDSRHQPTSDHGFDLTVDGDKVQPIIEAMHVLGIRVSLFMDPDLRQIELAKQVGADRIELYTGPFAAAFSDQSVHLDELFRRYCEAAELAHSLGLGVNAGHDLNLANMMLFRETPHLAEVSIGHALTVEALLNGWKPTIEAYLKICSPGRADMP